MGTSGYEASGTSASAERTYEKGKKMTESKARFSPVNPSPTSESLAAFLSADPAVVEALEIFGLTEFPAELVEAVRGGGRFQQWQQSPERDAERREARVAAAAAREIEKGEALIASKAKILEKLAAIEAAEAAAKAS